jgi:hypothetical protein
MTVTSSYIGDLLTTASGSGSGSGRAYLVFFGSGARGTNQNSLYHTAHWTQALANTNTTAKNLQPKPGDLPAGGMKLVSEVLVLCVMIRSRRLSLSIVVSFTSFIEQAASQPIHTHCIQQNHDGSITHTLVEVHRMTNVLGWQC